MLSLTSSARTWTALLTAIFQLSVLPWTAVADNTDTCDSSRLTIDRIYQDKEFDTKPYSARWLDGLNAFSRLSESSEHEDRYEIVRHDAATGKTEIMVAADELIPPGEDTPLEINDYAWSKDHAKLIIYTNSKRVWRKKTRGDYWLLDRTARQLTKLGGDGPPATMMFAKLSPTGRYVAYVRDRNIYVEDLFDHSIRCLTSVDRDEIINGTADWVYEEELSVRDGFRWSPDGKRIAYWQINTEGVGEFTLINNTDSLYPKSVRFAYPKVGQRNPHCRVGVVDCDSGETQWMAVPGDPRDHYIPRMQWADNSEELLIQQLNRLQNRNQLYLASATSGAAEPVICEKDESWVDVRPEVHWLAEGKYFTWSSERDGWRHIYLVSRSGKEIRLLTPGDFDVIRLLNVDEDNDRFYFIASPDNATERYLYSASLQGGDVQRATPAGDLGFHNYQFSDDSRWAIHRWSTAQFPTKTELVSLPQHGSERMLDENQKVIAQLKKLHRVETEFFRVEIEDHVYLDGWCIKPPNLDPSGSYPLLVYVYGEPAGSTVINRWGGGNYLWHLMLAQRGYVVMSFDNRGTKVPRGRAWRKSIYRKIGILGPKDQAAAVRAVLNQRPYLDPERVGIWGWSGGGSSSLQAIFKYPDLYSTAIAIASVPNQRYYDTIYQERYMGLPESNVRGYREGSAINFAKNLRGDLLLVHGTGDDNCHYQTVEMLIDELVAQDKQFSLMAYPNRTHAIKERENTTRHLRELMTRFLARTLPADPKRSFSRELTTSGTSE